jgi:hypothetical protein
LDAQNLSAPYNRVQAISITLPATAPEISPARDLPSTFQLHFLYPATEYYFPDLKYPYGKVKPTHFYQFRISGKAICLPLASGNAQYCSAHAKCADGEALTSIVLVVTFKNSIFKKFKIQDLGIEILRQR